MFTNLPPTPISELSKSLLTCLKAQEPFILHGDPAIGKSAVINQLAKRCKLELIDMRCSSKSSEDFEGLINFNADKTKAEYIPLGTLPLTDTPIPAGKKGWLLFLDELRQASPEILHSLYKVINERAVGDVHKLHPKVYICAASNLASNDNFLTPLPDPMISRLIHFKVVGDFHWWYKGWGEPNLHPILLAYFSSPSVHGDYTVLNNYATSEKGDIYASERTWEKMNNIFLKLDIKSPNDIDAIPKSLLDGTIGNRAAEDLLIWSKSQISPQSILGMLEEEQIDVTEFLIYTEEELSNSHSQMVMFMETVTSLPDFLKYYRRIRKMGEEIGTSFLFSNEKVAEILTKVGVDSADQMQVILKEQKDNVR